MASPWRKARNEALAVVRRAVQRRAAALRRRDWTAARSARRVANRARETAQEALKRLREARASRRPKIVNARLSISNLFGGLGPILYLTGHHSAGPTDRDDEHALTLVRQFDAQHRGQGWGGLGYHFNVTRRGTIILGRPVSLKGAHVGGHNSNNVGVLFHGTTGDVPTEAQARAFRWLLDNAHTSALPASHRTPRPLRDARRLGHKDWEGHHSNACPGTHHRMILSGGRTR